MTATKPAVIPTTIGDCICPSCNRTVRALIEAREGLVFGSVKYSPVRGQKCQRCSGTLDAGVAVNPVRSFGALAFRPVK